MGRIKKITNRNLLRESYEGDIYPVTAIKAVYDEKSEGLNHILDRNTVVNISTNYNDEHIAEVLTKEGCIAKIPEENRVLGFQGKYLSNDGWYSIAFIGDKISDWNDTEKWTTFPLDIEEETNKINEVINSKANTEDVQLAIKDLEGKIGDRTIIEGNVTNNPDEEDISTRNITGKEVLSFNDRTYNPLSFSGKGYKILRKNWVKDRNILTQNMINNANTIYEVRYDFDLGGKEIIIPKGCVLDFRGGSISNGSISGSGSISNVQNSKILSHIKLLGLISLQEVDLSWFVQNKNSKLEFEAPLDSTEEVQDAFDSGAKNLKISNGFYYITKSITAYSYQNISGVNFPEINTRNTSFAYPCFYTDKDIIVLKIISDFTDVSNIGAIKIDNLYIRRYCTFTSANDYNSNIPSIKIESGEDKNYNGCWGVYMNVHLYSADVPLTVKEQTQYFNGYTGIEIEAKNGGYFTFININGIIDGFRRAVYVHADDSPNSWITDVSLNFNSNCSYGGVLTSGSPFRIGGSHQPTMTLVDEDSPYYFSINGVGLSTSFIWDLGASNNKLHNAIYPFIASAGFIDLVNAISPVLKNRVLPPNILNIHRTQDYLHYFLSKGSNLLEIASLNLMGDKLLQGKSKPVIIKDYGTIESVRILTEDGSYIDLNSNNVHNFQFLFKVSSFVKGGNYRFFSSINDTYLSTDIPATYDRFEVIYSCSNEIASSFSYFFGIVSDETSIKIDKEEGGEYVNIYNEVLTSKDVKTAGFVCSCLPKINAPCRITIATKIVDEGAQRCLPKLSLLSWLSPVITMSGGEIPKRLSLGDVMYNNYELSTNNVIFRYDYNSVIGKLYSLNNNTYLPLVSITNSFREPFSILYRTYGEVKSLDVFPALLKVINTNTEIDIKVQIKDSKHYTISARGKSEIYILSVISVNTPVLIEDPITEFDSEIEALRHRSSGATSQRPVLAVSDEGYEYYDSTLKKKILWIGTQWTDMNGTPV